MAIPTARIATASETSIEAFGGMSWSSWRILRFRTCVRQDPLREHGDKPMHTEQHANQRTEGFPADLLWISGPL
jgi:hypothetical protein